MHDVLPQIFFECERPAEGDQQAETRRDERGCACPSGGEIADHAECDSISHSDLSYHGGSLRSEGASVDDFPFRNWRRSLFSSHVR